MQKKNLNASWKLIGMLVKRNSKEQTPISKLIRNNRLYTNKDEIADQLNEHFVNKNWKLWRKSNTIHKIDFGS